MDLINPRIIMDTRKLTASANESKRTFTLRINYSNGMKSKYRTLPMDKNEFRSAKYMTENDWFQFLKTDEYYPIK